MNVQQCVGPRGLTRAERGPGCSSALSAPAGPDRTRSQARHGMMLHLFLVCLASTLDYRLINHSRCQHGHPHVQGRSKRHERSASLCVRTLLPLCMFPFQMTSSSQIARLFAWWRIGLLHPSDLVSTVMPCSVAYLDRVLHLSLTAPDTLVPPMLFGFGRLS